MPSKPKVESRGWGWCLLPGNDHVRGQFGECHYCDDGYEMVDYYCELEEEQCRCVGEDDARCGWHNANLDVEEYYRLLAQEEGEQA